MLKVSAFTPTNGRVESLSFCKRYVESQTYPVHEHFIANGGTLCDNLIGSLPMVEGDLIVIFEDDDYYPPTWVEECVRAIESGVDAFGDARSHYYHLGLKRYRIFNHSDRASLSTTAFKRELVPTLIAGCLSHKAIDIRFWRKLRELEKPTLLRDDPTPLVVGLKGGPGLPGMGVGHIERLYLNHPSEADTEDYTVLRKLIGEEAFKGYQSF